MKFPKPTRRVRVPRPLRRSTKRIRTRRPPGTKRREAKAAGYVDELTAQAILEWYGWRCAYCMTRMAEQWDHVVPIGKDGKDEVENIVPSCGLCNIRKGTQTWEPRRRHPWMERLV